MGLYPKPFIDKMDPAIKKLVAQVRVASVNAQPIPAANPMQMPAGEQGMHQMPSAMPQGEQMPAGHPANMPAGNSGGHARDIPAWNLRLHQMLHQLLIRTTQSKQITSQSDRRIF